MGEALSRGELLRRRLFGRSASVRPPWSIAEAQFTELCSRCGDCIAACETEILIKGDGGFPAVDFSKGECTFCGACTEVCESGAILRPETPDDPPWHLTLTVGDGCLAASGVACRVCEDQCEPRAIRFKPSVTPRPPDIDQELCSGCGACVAPCPVTAIRLTPAAGHLSSSPSDMHQSKEAFHA